MKNGGKKIQQREQKLTAEDVYFFILLFPEVSR